MLLPEKPHIAPPFLRGFLETLSLLLVLLLAQCSDQNQLRPTHLLDAKPGISNAFIDSVASCLELFPEGTQISLVKIHDDSTIFFGAKRDKNRLVNVENADSVFEIGAITKVFTSSLLAYAVINDNLNADTSLQAFFDFPIQATGKDDKVLNLIMLSNHTSGLPRIPEGLLWAAAGNPSNPYAKYAKDQLNNYLRKKMRLLSVPGEKYAYSNLGAGILGYVLARQADMEYEQLLKSRIFTRYDMPSSTTNRGIIEQKLVKGLGPSGEAVPNWDFLALAGAGAVYSTGRDLSTFAKANFGEDEILSLQRQETFREGKDLAIAMGWHILSDEKGKQIYWHNGGTGGYRSSFGLDPQTRVAVIVLSNVSTFHKNAPEIDTLCLNLMKSLMNPD